MLELLDLNAMTAPNSATPSTVQQRSTRRLIRAPLPAGAPTLDGLAADAADADTGSDDGKAATEPAPTAISPRGLARRPPPPCSREECSGLGCYLRSCS